MFLISNFSHFLQILVDEIKLHTYKTNIDIEIIGDIYIDKVVEAKAQSNSTTCSSDGLHTTTTTHINFT